MREHMLDVDVNRALIDLAVASELGEVVGAIGNDELVARALKSPLIATSGHSREPVPPASRASMTGINVSHAGDSSLIEYLSRGLLQGAKRSCWTTPQNFG